MWICVFRFFGFFLTDAVMDMFGICGLFVFVHFQVKTQSTNMVEAQMCVDLVTDHSFISSGKV